MTPQSASHGPSENLHPRRKCRQSSSPCSHRPQGVGGHPVNHCFIKFYWLLEQNSEEVNIAGV